MSFTEQQISDLSANDNVDNKRFKYLLSIAENPTIGLSCG